jgi:hypothetical protein
MILGFILDYSVVILGVSEEHPDRIAFNTNIN